MRENGGVGRVVGKGRKREERWVRKERKNIYNNNNNNKIIYKIIKTKN